MHLSLYNGTIYTGRQTLTGKAILADDGTITGIVDKAEVPSCYVPYDLLGMNIAASLIDMQIYGGNGRLFSNDLSVASLAATHEYCRNGGAANFMITMATNSIEKFVQGIDVVKAYWEQGGKGLLGLHLEGPYINPVKKGAHLEQHIRQPAPEEVRYLLERGRGVVKMITVAPEVCSEAVMDLLLQSGLIVSAGHSNATYRQGMNAFDRGIPAATHLFNAMSPLQGREPGMVGAIYDHAQVRSSVVCDGVHVDFASIRISRQLMQQRLFFITDAVTETAGDYTHVFRGDRYTLPDGVLSGSALTMMQCVRNGVQHVGIELAEALRMASLYPAALLGKDCTLGQIREGFAASFVVFDDALNVVKCIDA